MTMHVIYFISRFINNLYFCIYSSCTLHKNLNQVLQESDWSFVSFKNLKSFFFTCSCLLTFVFIRCTICCHWLSLFVSLTVICWYWLSFVITLHVICCHLLYHWFSLVVTRCTTLLFFFKRSCEKTKY